MFRIATLHFAVNNYGIEFNHGKPKSKNDTQNINQNQKACKTSTVYLIFCAQEVSLNKFKTTKKYVHVMVLGGKLSLQNIKLV